MTNERRIAAAKDKPLFTPGPLTTSQTVKQAMLRDLGSRDVEFIGLIRDVRTRLLRVAGVSKEDGYEAVLMQGSGTFGLEATISSAIAPEGKLLVIINGAYGHRIAKMARIHRIDTATLIFPESEKTEPKAVERALSTDPAITAVAIVHCETTTGIFNPVDEIGAVVGRHGKTYIVDSMSAFGAVPLDMRACGADYIISSANKCIEGVPGFSFVICRREALLGTEGWARTLSLDLLAQWRGLEANGQFRFTPPTHAILAFARALEELEAEGGAEGRANRYKSNHATICEGMRQMGFTEYLAPQDQGYIITSFRYPKDPSFDFEAFYARLNAKGFVIYPGKVSDADCFRIGHIGRLFPSDMQMLLAAIREVVADMGIAKTSAT
jgi:2-aminoethylphosphonate-pyruvate transaminase